MAVTVRPFESYHLDLLRAQGIQSQQLKEVSLVPGSFATLPAPQGLAVTAFDGSRVIICGGIREDMPKRGTCWALMAADSGDHMLFLHRAVCRFMRLKSWDRLEATVAADFKPACRWVELLGFQFEGRMKRYGLNGEDHLRYAWLS